LVTKYHLFLKKYFLGRCQYQNKKALFTNPIFSEGFGQKVKYACIYFVKMKITGFFKNKKIRL